ncbi:translation initiation factor IF-2-like [Zalophus californianus]|uniref:Translation initiation factor IF-2-like n=1 Tax=Zalophus californianus TaxID=9704 RepID=A0A6J2D5K8_ZALCA|nr:translation initiation factor IF-2-like [Zalophus californianus]
MTWDRENSSRGGVSETQTFPARSRPASPGLGNAPKSWPEPSAKVSVDQERGRAGVGEAVRVGGVVPPGSAPEPAPGWNRRAAARAGREGREELSWRSRKPSREKQRPFPGADPGSGERAPPAGPAPGGGGGDGTRGVWGERPDLWFSASARPATGAGGRERRGAGPGHRILPGGAGGTPCATLGEGAAGGEASGAGEGFGVGAPRKPSALPPARRISPAGHREPRPPPAAGARAPPSPRQVPKLGKLFNPFRGAAVPGTQPSEREVGSSGQRLLWKFPGVFAWVTGRRGPFGSCQGVRLSQNRTVLLQTLRSAQFPPSARDFLIRPAAIGWAEEGDGARCSGCVGNRDPESAGRGRKEALPPPPTAPQPLTSDFRYPGEEGPGMPAAICAGRSAPDSTAPGGRPTPAGAGSWALRLQDQACAVASSGWARSGVVTLPPPLLCAGEPHSVLSWGHVRGRTAPPYPCREPSRL